VPARDPDQVYGGGCDDVLEMGLGQPDIATPAQAASTDRLRTRAFDPGACGIILLELFRRLVSASGSQRRIIFARPQADDTRLRPLSIRRIKLRRDPLP
jgi:hypothetical protein